MSKAGFIFLVMAVGIPLVMSRSGKYDKYHFEIALMMYAFSILGIAMIALDV